MWAIVSMQRAGTHLLISLLDSHPVLTGYGEVLRMGEPEFRRELGENEGIIVMYNQIIRGDADGLLEGVKIIHLTRNLGDNAYSWALLARRGEGKLEYWPVSHEIQEVKAPRISLSEIEQRKQKILEYQRVAMARLKPSRVFEITYEYICGGNREILELSKEKAAPMLEFLGVEPVKLTTGLRKARYIYENSDRL